MTKLKVPKAGDMPVGHFWQHMNLRHVEHIVIPPNKVNPEESGIGPFRVVEKLTPLFPFALWYHEMEHRTRPEVFDHTHRSAK